MLDMQILDYLIITPKLIVSIFDKNADSSRDIYLLQALKEYRTLRQREEMNDSLE